MPILVQCGACGRQFRAPDQFAGRQAKCPQCGGVIAIPQPTDAIPVASRPVAAASPKLVPPPQASLAPSPRSVMADLLDETASEPAPPIRCGNCGRTLPAETVICVACGYNLRTRQRMSTVVERPPEEGKATQGIKAAAGFAGSFVIGCIACSVATAVGMGIWIGVAIATELEIGWIAWGLGVLAGLGMRLGYGKEDDVAGITAAFIALFGILGTKWAIFQSLMANIRDSHLLDGVNPEDLPSMSSLFFTSMIGPVGTVFLLLAFFTAYRVGSGKSFT